METPELLAELHGARVLARSARCGSAARGATGAARVSDAALWRHARRRPGDAISLAVQRALADVETGRRYRTMLAALAVAHSPVALAAADGTVRRRVGRMVLELLQDGPPLLVIHLDGVDPPPTLLELVGADHSVRLGLPPATDGALVLSLEGDLDVPARARAMLRDPATELFLL